MKPTRDTARPARGLFTAVALGQGLWLRGRIEVLPPAAGPVTGSTGSAEDAARISVVILGESTAAGCGVDSHEDGFAGSFAATIAERTGHAVDWTVVGESGATSRRIRHKLMPRLSGRYDVAVLLAGANDVLQRRDPAEWRDNLGYIVDQLGGTCGSVIVVGTPPFPAFPALPRTLAHYLAARAARLDVESAAVCAARPGVHFVTGLADTVDEEFFARDGFHPGPHGYRVWARSIAEALPVQSSR